jgi:D-3-phosphoglycerate dehydrogenase / 2-oxoglutarate reductase
MNIVILDDYQDCVRHLACFQLLVAHQVSIYNDTVKTTDALVARLCDADAVVLTRERTAITAELVARLPKLKLIAQTGKAGNHIDHAACAAQGISIVDSKGSGTATAELSLLLILASLRHFVSEVNRLQQGQWQGSVGRQLAGKTVGVLGYGRIAQQVCQLLDAFGAQVLVWGRASSGAHCGCVTR